MTTQIIYCVREAQGFLGLVTYWRHGSEGFNPNLTNVRRPRLLTFTLSMVEDNSDGKWSTGPVLMLEFWRPYPTSLEELSILATLAVVKGILEVCPN